MAFASVLRATRLRRAPELGHCLVCRRPLGRHEPAVTLRAGALAHRDCATYRVRQLNSLGRRPLPAPRAPR